MPHRSIAETLASAQNVLLLGVGGGNDSITSLLLRAQLAATAQFQPRRLQVAAMLPDVMRYSECRSLDGEAVVEITAESRRWIGKKPIKEFPEPILAAQRAEFGVDRVLGLSMAGGSNLLTRSLRDWIQREQFDLVLACDVGGDFIATPSNFDVLSPMMDAYALSALRRLDGQLPGVDFLYGVFGLGTDGESTPLQLQAALQRIEPYLEGKFDPATIAPIEDFYRRWVEPNRVSRTANFTLRSIHGEHIEPTLFRARFYTHPSASIERRYYGEFLHHFDPAFAGCYYLFDSLEGVANPFEKSCSSGLDWFLQIQGIGRAVNHELNGQSYRLTDSRESNPKTSLYFGTPSHRFATDVRREIMADIAASIGNGVFDAALIYRSDASLADWSGLSVKPIDGTLALVALPNRLRAAISQVESHRSR